MIDYDNLLSPPRHARATLQGRCSRSCEYYRICGGEFYGSKVLFNGTLASAANPYCDVLAKRFFDRLLSREIAP
jgi:sulfatase maturation enzyme AslB (radical SAM superfamily)